MSDTFLKLHNAGQLINFFKLINLIFALDNFNLYNEENELLLHHILLKLTLYKYIIKKRTPPGKSCQKFLVILRADCFVIQVEGRQRRRQRRSRGAWWPLLLWISGPCFLQQLCSTWQLSSQYIFLSKFIPSLSLLPNYFNGTNIFANHKLLEILSEKISRKKRRRSFSYSSFWEYLMLIESHNASLTLFL